MQAGAPPERIELSGPGSPIGLVTALINARELGGSLFVTGVGFGREDPRRVLGERALRDPRPFVAIVATNPGGATSVVASFLARSAVTDTSSFAGAIDPARGRFGLSLTTASPTDRGGTTFVLPIDVDARAAEGFLSFGASEADLARPTRACGTSESAWDRAEIKRKRALTIALPGLDLAMIEGDAGALRLRVGEAGACLDRLTVIGPTGAFQLDATTGEATAMTLDATKKGAFSRTLRCTVEWK
ncbi:MAG: hypothetical protein ACHREM_26370 [Polyangiales bacterium]